jgi:hypothetical protein
MHWWMRMWKLSSLKAWHMAVATIGIAIVLVLVYFQALNGEPYTFASEWAGTDERVLDLSGAQVSRKLDIWSGYESSYGDRDGSASLVMNVFGVKRKLILFLDLRKDKGAWSVEKAVAKDPSTSEAISLISNNSDRR